MKRALSQQAKPVTASATARNGIPASTEAGEVIKFNEAGMPQLDVWLEDETIWLTQKQMGELFGCAPQNITYHLRAIFKIGELSEQATCKEFLQVQMEGKRRISRLQKFYNLDAIISVGYRVNSIERSIDTIIYTLMPPLDANRKPIGFQYTEG